MDRRAYLDRIGYNGSLTASAYTLRQLQVAHLQSVPFENLSIHVGEPIVLDNDALFDKIVTRRRGGFCYELNGLFAWLLRDLGFDVTMLAAEVMNAQGQYGEPFDHMALVVRLDEPWLVDVGFGESFVEPLRLVVGTPQEQYGRSYQIEEWETRLLVRQRDPGSDWRTMYRFDLRPFEFPDYAGMCRYHQTSPDSPFTQRHLCTLATPGGRVTLAGWRLITTAGGRREERGLLDEKECARVLAETFGIRLQSPLPSAPR
jgi:N-hydroxyarylamine O-acetyltransferase